MPTFKKNRKKSIAIWLSGQLCLFDARVMKRMERKPTIEPKQKKRELMKQERDAIAVLAMQDCMWDGDYDGPETAEELCAIFGFID
jgi:hypothetical protein